MGFHATFTIPPYNPTKLELLNLLKMNQGPLLLGTNGINGMNPTKHMAHAQAPALSFDNPAPRCHS